MKKTVYIVSLGCPKNLVDSEVMLGQLEKAGYESTPTPDTADLLLVNTCGFIGSAVEEAIDEILALVKYKEDGTRRLAVTGCLVQRYGEGLFMGYRWYDARDLPPRFPVGHGLSYGSADWGAPTADRRALGAGGSVTVTVPITAGDDRDATVVVQGYVAPVEPTCVRPPKELKAWSKTVVPAGTSRNVTVEFGPDSFHHWDTATGDWLVSPGDYDLVVAASAGDERGRVRVTVS